MERERGIRTEPRLQILPVTCVRRAGPQLRKKQSIMSIKHLFRICAVLAALVISISPLNAQPVVAMTGADTIRVAGLVAHPFGISSRDAAGLSLHDAPAHEMRNRKGELKKSFPAAKAYLLKDLIGKAEPVTGEHKEQGKFIVVVTAVDGYTVVFSYGELIYGAAADKTWLMPVSSNEKLRGDGPFVLLSMSDKVSAPRYVKWVKSIELRKI